MIEELFSSDFHFIWIGVPHTRGSSLTIILITKNCALRLPEAAVCDTPHTNFAGHGSALIAERGNALDSYN